MCLGTEKVETVKYRLKTGESYIKGKKMYRSMVIKKFQTKKYLVSYFDYYKNYILGHLL